MPETVHFPQPLTLQKRENTVYTSQNTEDYDSSLCSLVSENHKLSSIWYQYVFLKKSTLNKSTFSKKKKSQNKTKKPHPKTTTKKTQQSKPTKNPMSLENSELKFTALLLNYYKNKVINQKYSEYMHPPDSEFLSDCQGISHPDRSYSELSGLSPSGYSMTNQSICSFLAYSCLKTYYSR